MASTAAHHKLALLQANPQSATEAELEEAESAVARVTAHLHIKQSYQRRFRQNVPFRSNDGFVVYTNAWADDGVCCASASLSAASFRLTCASASASSAVPVPSSTPLTLLPTEQSAHSGGSTSISCTAAGRSCACACGSPPPLHRYTPITATGEWRPGVEMYIAPALTTLLWYRRENVTSSLVARLWVAQARLTPQRLPLPLLLPTPRPLRAGFCTRTQRFATALLCVCDSLLDPHSVSRCVCVCVRRTQSRGEAGLQRCFLFL